MSNINKQNDIQPNNENTIFLEKIPCISREHFIGMYKKTKI